MQEAFNSLRSVLIAISVVPAVRTTRRAQALERDALEVLANLVVHVVRVDVAVPRDSPLTRSFGSHQQRQVLILCTVAVRGADEVVAVDVVLAMP